MNAPSKPSTATPLTPVVFASIEATKPGPANEAIDLRFIPVAELLIDQAYQRKLSEKSKRVIRKIVGEFTWSRFGAINVAERPEGGFLVIDGQHRAIAALHCGVTDVPATVSAGAQAAQALDFVAVNSNRSAVTAVDKFRARVTAGEPDALELDEVLRGLEISADVAPGCVMKPKETRSISLLQKLIKSPGKGILFTALELLIDAQPDTTNLLSSFAIEVTAIVTTRVIDKGGDIDRLAGILEETDFETMKYHAGGLVKTLGGRTGHRGATLLARAYNKGLQNRIPE